MHLQVFRDTESAGLARLAEGLRGLVDWRREELQVLLLRPDTVLDCARLQGQDLSRMGFAKRSLRRADLSNCDLAECIFDSSDMRGANLSGSDCSGADLSNVNLNGAKLQGARLPWDSGLM